MRVDAELSMHLPCPHCGATSWSDLRNRETARLIDEIDVYEAEERRTRLRRRLARLVAVAAITIGGLVMSAAVVPKHGWFGVIGVFIGLALAVVPVIATPSGASTRTRRRRQPSRWHLVASRSPRPRGKPETGPLRTEASLTAPLTGRPCVAYELGIRRDDRTSASVSTWALLEQRSAEGRVGTLALAKDQVFLRLRRTRVEGHDIALDTEQKTRLLRARGLDPDEDYVLYETIVPEGATCRAWAGGRGQPPVLDLT